MVDATKTSEIPLLDSLLEQPCDDATLAALDDVSLEDRIDQYVGCCPKKVGFSPHVVTACSPQVVVARV